MSEWKLKMNDQVEQQMYEDISQSRNEIETKAQINNCEPIFGNESTIQLDLDSTVPPRENEDFNQQLRWLAQQCGMPYDYESWKSRNGNWHVQIKLPNKVDVHERLLLQCLLGSDLKRELLNYTRYNLNGDDMSCLFKPFPLQLEAAKESA